MIPSVAATVALLGFLPVANAFGMVVGIMAIFGIGRPDRSAMLFTVR